MTEEDEEFDRIEREAAMRKEAVAATVEKPMHPEIKKMYEDYFDKCFRASSPQRDWVGLTDDEIDGMVEVTDLSGAYYYDDLHAVVRAAEKLLKEKNEM